MCDGMKKCEIKKFDGETRRFGGVGNERMGG